MALDAPLARAPTRRSNLEAVAMAYHEACIDARQATVDKTIATKHAVEAGVLFDHKKDPRPPGTNEVVYDGTTVRIVLTVATPAEKLDVAGFIEGLRLAAVKESLIARLVKKHTSLSAAAHSFTSSLVGDVALLRQ